MQAGNWQFPEAHLGHDVHIGDINNFGINTIVSPDILVGNETVFDAGA